MSMTCNYSSNFLDFVYVTDVVLVTLSCHNHFPHYLIAHNSMHPSFKPATLTDLDRLLGFMQQFYEGEHVTFELAPAQAALSQLLHDSTLGRVWLIQLDDVAIGYVVLTLGYSLEFQGQDAFIDELFICPDNRGHGIGTKTIEFVEAACSTLQIKALHLEVDRHNTVAQALYGKTGFVASHRHLMTKLIRL